MSAVDSSENPPGPEPQEPEDSGVIPQQIAGPDEPTNAGIDLAPASRADYEASDSMAEAVAVAGKLFRNDGVKAIVLYGIAALERELADRKEELKKLREERDRDQAAIAELRRSVALLEERLESARGYRQASNMMVTVGVLLVGLAFDLRAGPPATWVLLGLIGVCLTLYGWLGLDRGRGPK